eukprot:COSAG01_NODE_4485_length_4983_cov_3.863432_8_plen_132_part_00
MRRRRRQTREAAAAAAKARVHNGGGGVPGEFAHLRTALGLISREASRGRDKSLTEQLCLLLLATYAQQTYSRTCEYRTTQQTAEEQCNQFRFLVGSYGCSMARRHVRQPCFFLPVCSSLTWPYRSVRRSIR